MISKIGDLTDHKILVTGACGFLGVPLIQTLLENGAWVIGVDFREDLPQDFVNLEKHPFFQLIPGHFVECQEQIASSLASANRDQAAIFHLAGMAHVGECDADPLLAFESNVSLTCHVLEFCRKNHIQQFVFPSTGLIYGDQALHSLTEEMPAHPPNIYAFTKLAAETMIQGYAERYGMVGIAARLSNVYSIASNPATVLGTILQQARNKEKIEVRDMSPVRDFIYIDDVVEGLIRLMLSMKKTGFQVINLSTGVGTSIQSLVKTVCELISLPMETNPGPINTASSHMILQNHRLFKETGWRPKYSLSEGLSFILQHS